MPTLHVHLDESGTRLRFSLLKQGHNLPAFHATTDRQVNRDAVVRALAAHANWRFAAVVIERAKVNPAIREPHRFYPKFASIKTACRHELDPAIRFESYHHPAASNAWIQAADYCSWAIFKKWEHGDERTYGVLSARLAARELDALRLGTMEYY